MEPGLLQLRSDVLVKCYAVNSTTVSSSQLSPRSDVKLLFRCQFHTSALSSQSLEFTASDLDLETPAQGHRRSLEGLRVEFNFSPTASTARCELLLLHLEDIQMERKPHACTLFHPAVSRPVEGVG